MTDTTRWVPCQVCNEPGARAPRRGEACPACEHSIAMFFETELVPGAERLAGATRRVAARVHASRPMEAGLDGRGAAPSTTDSEA